MWLKGVIDEDFVNYRKPSMVLMMPNCDWKCGAEFCQNTPLAQAKSIDVDPCDIAKRYHGNPLSSSLVFSGLEPFDDFKDVYEMIDTFREISDDDIIIFTGYDEHEIKKKLEILQRFRNIYVKFGRFIPGDEQHYDNVLGVFLSSNNQYGKKIC